MYFNVIHTDPHEHSHTKKKQTKTKKEKKNKHIYIHRTHNYILINTPKCILLYLQ